MEKIITESPNHIITSPDIKIVQSIPFYSPTMWLLFLTATMVPGFFLIQGGKGIIGEARHLDRARTRWLLAEKTMAVTEPGAFDVSKFERNMGKTTGWWFGTFSIFPYIGNNHPNWLSYLSEGWPNHQPDKKPAIWVYIPPIYGAWGDGLLLFYWLQHPNERF